MATSVYAVAIQEEVSEVIKRSKQQGQSFVHPTCGTRHRGQGNKSNAFFYPVFNRLVGKEIFAGSNRYEG
jgi:hypothetical protein